MGHPIVPRFAAIAGVMLVALMLILPDIGTNLGTDLSYYLDIASVIQRGGKLFQDYVDYRLPVFSMLASPLLGIIHNDVLLRLTVIFCIYAFYGVAIYLVSLFVLRVSSAAAVAGAIVALITVASHNYDPARNAVMPLFHETMSFVAVALILFGLGEGASSSPNRQIMRAVIAGIACGIGFLGRQVGILPGLLMILLLAGLALRMFRTGETRRAILFLWIGFPIGFSLTAAAIISVLLWENPHFFPSVLPWLFGYPSNVYVGGGFLWRAWTPFASLLEFYRLGLWGLWLAVVAVAAHLILRAKNQVAPIERRRLFLPAIIGFGYFLVPFLIGHTMLIYQTPAITVCALITALALNGATWPAFRRAALIPFIAVSPLLLSLSIVEARGVNWGLKGVRDPDGIFANRLVKTLREAMAKAGPDVLNLGGWSSVARIAKYNNFAGISVDCLIYEAPRFLPPDQSQALLDRLGELDVMFGYMDVPCISDAVISPALREYFSKNFEVFAQVSPTLAYPYHYTTPMTVYIRKTSKRSELRHSSPTAPGTMARKDGHLR